MNFYNGKLKVNIFFVIQIISTKYYYYIIWLLLLLQMSSQYIFFVENWKQYFQKLYIIICHLNIICLFLSNN